MPPGLLDDISPPKTPGAAYAVVGAVLLLIGLAWFASLVHSIMTVKGSYHFSWYEEHTVQDNIRRSAPFLVFASIFILIGVAAVCRRRWAAIKAVILLGVTVTLLSLFALFYLFLKLTGSAPFPV